MSERYKTLFRLEHRLYTSGAPVMISAGALLHDNYSNALLCQLKIRNIQARPIRALRASVQMLDVDGETLGQPVDHRYLDLELQQEQEFGRDVAIVLPSREARSFTVRVRQVSFTDGEIWQDKGAAWAELEDQPTLADYYGDPEMETQFQIRYGADCKYAPVAEKELWFCTCGAVNRMTESKCHVCRRRRSALLDVNAEALRTECLARQENERKMQSEEAKEARKRRKKLLLSAAIVLPLLILALSLVIAVPPMVERSRAYGQACELLDSHRFEEAEAAFAALGDYRNSRQYVETILPYRLAQYLMERADADDASALSLIGLSRDDLSEEESASSLLYRAAMEGFEALGDYADSVKNRDLCRDALEAQRLEELQQAYDDAETLLEQKSYSLARQAFLDLEDYSDAAEQAKEAVYRKAMALYDYVQQYNVSGMFASLSMDPDRPSTFSLSDPWKTVLGEQAISDLRDAFGGDAVSILTEESPDKALTPLSDALAGLFVSLGDYRDSAACAAALPGLTDYTGQFRRLCENGQLPEARAWLETYEGVFEDRELWLERLEMYLPYCGSWTLQGGDPTLIPRITGRDGSCYDFRTLVVLREDTAVLRILVPGEAEYSLDLCAEMGKTDFQYNAEGFRYTAVFGSNGNFTVLKWVYTNILSSCEYSAAEEG